MRSELEEVRLIDRYLFRQLGETEARTFETNLMLNGTLVEKVKVQRMAHRLIRLYAREKERSRLEAIHRQLLDEPLFAHQLKTIFTL
jgi:hypothetical protein